MHLLMPLLASYSALSLQCIEKYYYYYNYGLVIWCDLI